MKKERILLALVLAFGLFLALRPGSRVRAQEDDENPCRIGFVDVNRVFNEYRMSRDFEKEFAETNRRDGEEIAQLRKSLDRIFEQLGKLEKGTKEYEEFLAQYVGLEKKILTEEREKKLRSKARLLDGTRKIYRSIIENLDAFARQRRLDAVLKVDRNPIRADEVVGFFEKMDARPVLAHRRELDITTPFLAYLNRK
jgi:Skp family chaperone for outer membrane proteins